MYFTNRSSDTLSDSSVRPDGLKGADAPEERLVKKMKKVRLRRTLQIVHQDRILCEFPELWAVSNTWSPLFDEIKIVSPDNLLESVTYNIHCFWIGFAGIQGARHVKKADLIISEGAQFHETKPGKLKLAILLLQWVQDMDSQYRIRSVIHRIPVDRGLCAVGHSYLTTIVRPPKRGDLHSLCLQIAAKTN